MALTAPIEVPAHRLSTGDVQGSEVIVDGDDLDRVRLYGRLAAAMQAAAVVLLALVAIQVSTLLLGVRWDSRQALVALTAALAVAAVQYLRAALRLRSYRLDLTADAIVFAYGRTRWYVPREHIQLFDTESSMLLRRFGLRRCNLHTGGGTVVISPAPARVAAAIEQLISEQPAPTALGHTDAGS